MNGIVRISQWERYTDELEEGAATNNVAAIVRALDKGININKSYCYVYDPEGGSYTCETALHIAAQKGHVLAVTLLIERKADLEAVKFPGHTYSTPFQTTCSNLYSSIYKPEYFYRNQEQLAHLYECMRLLVRNGANPTWISVSYTLERGSFSQNTEFLNKSHEEALKMIEEAESKLTACFLESTSFEQNTIKLIASYSLSPGSHFEKVHAKTLKIVEQARKEFLEGPSAIVNISRP